MSTTAFYLVWRLNYYLRTDDRWVLIRMLIPISIYLSLQCASANYSALKSWTRPFSSKSPCRTDWVTREENKTWCWWTTMTTLHIITNQPSCLQMETWEESRAEDRRVINCDQPCPVQSDELYCAKLLRLSDKLVSWAEQRILLSAGGEYLCFNLNNWDLSWCVAARQPGLVPGSGRDTL